MINYKKIDGGADLRDNPYISNCGMRTDSADNRKYSSDNTAERCINIIPERSRHLWTDIGI